MITLRSMRRWALGTALVLAGAILASGTGLRAQERGPVLVLTIKGAIGPATSDYISRGMERARALSARAVVIRMDTPGGLSSAMRDIIKDILASPVPVLTYVSPAGARAASAGTYIMYASHVAAMAPGTNLGAATPIQIGGGGLLPGIGGQPKPEGGEGDKGGKSGGTQKGAKPAPYAKPGEAEKMVNDARAYIRSLAELRGRNVAWAERAVAEAASLSATEALKQHVIDLMADNLSQLLVRADGRKVKVAGGAEVTVDTAGAPVREFAPDWRTKALSIITDPNVAYLLMLVGFYGIIFEFYNPGTFVSGVVGAISLLLALFAFNVLPVNYAGLALIVLGFALMMAEAFVPSFGALGIGGIAALVLGSVILFDTNVPEFEISLYLIGAVALVSVGFVFAVLALAARAWRRPVVSGREAMMGATGQVIDWAGGTGSVRVHGEVWKARGAGPFAPGQAVRIFGLSGLTLEVRPDGAGPNTTDTDTGDENGNRA